MLRWSIKHAKVNTEKSEWDSVACMLGHDDLHKRPAEIVRKTIAPDVDTAKLRAD